MTPSALRSSGVALLFVALTVMMTWPQSAKLATHVHDTDDPLLSIWRVSWIAHILPAQPVALFDANIFHPERRTLAYSDSVLLQGAAGAPLIWAGVSQVATYNLLLLLSIALSGWAMWRYAFHLTGHHAGAILAGIVFAFVPYRFDHYHHLELQATVFLPLTLLYFDRLADSRSTRDAWLMAATFTAQVYSCIYYSMFLLTAMAPLAAYRLWRETPDGRRKLVRAAAPALAVALAVVVPYLLVYAMNRQTLGERVDGDVRLYSASVANYLATPVENLLHGGWSAALGAPERRLFPGVLAMALAAAGLMRARRRLDLVAIGAIGFVISLGLNSPLYEPLRAIVFPYRGLRAPARASILVFLAIAALVAFGWTRITRRLSPRSAAAAALACALLLLLEYRTRMEAWLELPRRPAEVYRWLATQPRAVIAEFPFARAHRLHSIGDGLYMFNSTWHWQPTVNGYSGFYPDSFIDLSQRLATFPDDQSIAALKERGVELMVIHGGMMSPEEFGEMTSALLARPDIEAMARFDAPLGPDAVFRVRR